jgi:hypothetical protein
VLSHPAPAQPASFTTGAFPNLLQSIVIIGNRAYLPNTASSPNGPFKFNVNVQGFLSVFDINTDTDSGQTINMNSGVQFELQNVKLFITNPIATQNGTPGRGTTRRARPIPRARFRGPCQQNADRANPGLDCG